jgi:two-component system response regulator PilR (NtrC family)
MHNSSFSNNGSRRVLLVDDEAAILLAFSKILGSPDVTIDTAQTVEEAKSALETHAYLVVIADLRLTGATVMDGFDVIRHSKQSHPEAKIIVITAYGESQTREKVFELGADYYFEKPISPRKIREVLDELGVYAPDRGRV